MFGCSSVERPEELVVGKKVDEATLTKAKEIVGYRCKKVKKTGSRLGHKQCTTSKQREEAKERARELMQENQNENQVFVEAGKGL